MGVVYLGVAWDGTPVAVKVLRPDLADDEEFRRRFGREVSALVQVKGECTVRVIEADSQTATPFVVTEYAPGPSLSEYMDKNGSVDPEMLFGLATGLAEALTVIHAAGIMHRDLKPSNIILTDAGPKAAAGHQRGDQGGHDDRLDGLHGTRADHREPRPGGGRLRLGRHGGVRGVRPVTVRCREHPHHPLPDHVRRRGHQHGPGLAASAGGSRPDQGPAEPPDRAAAAGPADERLPAARADQREPHPADPAADLAERLPPQPVTRQPAALRHVALQPAALRQVALRQVALRQVAVPDLAFRADAVGPPG
jgi:hypothetical protein